MTWWYEIRDSDNQVLEIRRGFPSEKDAKEMGELARLTIQDISPGRTLTLLTGEDIWRAE